MVKQARVVTAAQVAAIVQPVAQVQAVAPQQVTAPVAMVQHLYPIVTNAQRRVRTRAIAALQVRAAKNVARAQRVAQANFMLAVQQAAAQYGINPAQVLAPQQVSAYARANSATVVPSVASVQSVGGLKPCKAVHAICATLPATATRAQQIAAAVAQGINPATASTQVGIYRKAALQASNK